MSYQDNAERIAIIGMSGRFPGAADVRQLWQNLIDGVESISFFTDEELAASGVDVESIRGDSSYVRARGIIEGADMLDARFFGINPREAQVMDPQHKVLLEEAWLALENAAHDPDRFDGLIGVYAGAAKNTYFQRNLLPHRGSMGAVDGLVAELGNIPDYLTTRISYKLNLRGPSVAVHTACSTSLVAVYHACQSLLNYHCDMALAGGVTILLPQKKGHWSTEGDILSPDGHTRTFDAEGQGTVFSNGAAMVVLRRLEDALEDGDRILGVIRGIAINNDGAAKVGFGAPSIEGQAEVIEMAQAIADVSPRDISYVECHGTATPLGDPIEVAALTRAFRTGTEDRGFCALGSAKSNFGHLDAAAGVTGLIKTALALRHRVIPPTLHVKQPNPKFEIENTPFFINDRMRAWDGNGGRRLAGVSSFGVGGTNAHAVLEEPPPPLPSGGSRARQLLLVSARTETAADEACIRLANHLEACEDTSPEYLADVAHTLRVGRQQMDHCRFAVCGDVAEAVARLRSSDGVKRGQRKRRERQVVYLLPGQGAQHPNMGRALYESEPTFRDIVDRCAEILDAKLDVPLLDVLYPPEGEDRAEEAARRLRETHVTQPTLFVVEYALAHLWMDWGVQPSAFVGHSVGEFVAACLASVIDLEDALDLLAERGRLMQGLPSGGMLAVSMTEEDLRPRLPQALSVAAVNSPKSCVVSGPHEELDEFQATLDAEGVSTRALHTSHAFHSAMMEPVVDPFTAVVATKTLRGPRIPFTSSVTGGWITAEMATDPRYWASHLRQAVRFADARRLVAEEMPEAVLLEVGPGSTLSALSNHPSFKAADQRAISSLGHVLDERNELDRVLEAMGGLWMEGVSIDWNKFADREKRRRVELPPYPFERKRFWIDPPAGVPSTHSRDAGAPAPEMALEATSSLPPEAPMSGEPENNAREQWILGYIKEVMDDLGGLEPDDVNVDATFLDLGFDSLFLTQAGLAFKKKFGVKVTLRQLLEDAPTPGALASFLDATLEPEAFREEWGSVAPPPPAAPPASLSSTAAALAATPAPQFPTSDASASAPAAAGVPAALVPGLPAGAPGPGSALENMVRQQLQLMARQLELLAGGAATAPASMAAAPVPSASAGPVTADTGPVTPAPSRETTDAGDVDEAAGADVEQRFGPWKPIDKADVAGLDERRAAALDELVSRYTRKTAGSKALTVEHRGHLADPRTVSGFRTTWKEMVYPIAATRSKGSRIWDVDGNEYIDLRSGFGSVFFGHSPDFVTKALHEQLENGVQIGPILPIVGQVAKSICELTGMDRATFCNTGSEAVMATMRVARTVTGREKIVLFSKDYHGIFDEVLVRGVGRKIPAKSRPIAPGIPESAVNHIVVLEYGDPAALEWIAANGAEIAAVLVEPVQSRHPDLQPREFLHSLRKLTRDVGAALIFDEVITGFRLHPGGAQGWYGIEADLASYGKIVGGGMPMGVVAGRRRWMDALDGGHWEFGDDSFPEVGVTYFAGTFQRHPLAIVAALAVTEELKRRGPELQRSVGERCAGMVEFLTDHFRAVGAPIHIERCESMFGFRFAEEHEFTSLFYFYLREKGINIWEGGSSFMTAAHTNEDIDQIIRAVVDTVAEMQRAGFLAGTTPDDLLEVASRSAASRRLALTEAQKEIWLACQLSDQASCAYNESDTLELSGPLNVDVLRQSVNRVLGRHAALHVRFDEMGEYQELLPFEGIEIPLHDFADDTPEKRDERVNQLIVDEIATLPMDLSRGPLVRSMLIRLEEDRHLFILAAHHIVVDGWSAGVLLDEISAVYSATLRGEEPSLRPPDSFRRYVGLELAAAKTPEMAASLEYWQERFEQPPAPLELPLDRPRGASRSHAGSTLKSKLRAETYEAAQAITAGQSVTMFVTLLAAYKALLFRLSGQEDIVVGMPTAGQAITGMDTLVGHCVNLLPVRSILDADMTVAEQIKQLRADVLDAYEHQECTFGSIVRMVPIDRDPSRLPLVEVIFNLNRDRAMLDFEGLTAHFHENPRRAVNFDLFFNIYEGESGLTVDLDYNTDLFDAATVERWIRHYENILIGMAADASAKLADLPLLSDAEAEVLLSRARGEERT